MPQNDTGKNIILAVTGSIAAYKSASVLRGLTNRGHTIQVIMTQSARQFIMPTTFRALSGRPVITELFVKESQASLVHVELAEWVDVLAVVPATANIIGKLACGLADEIVSCTWMACDCPKLIAPAMNDRMWASPAVQRNCSLLGEVSGVEFVGPVEGRLASGKVALGKLADIDEIVGKIHLLAAAKNQDPGDAR